MTTLNNVIYKGKDNEVFVSFSFDGDFAALGLSNFDEVTLSLGGEDYSTLTTPAQLFLKDNFTLALKIGDTTSLDVGQYPPSITGVSTTYNDGYVLNCASSSKIASIVIKSC